VLTFQSGCDDADDHGQRYAIRRVEPNETFFVNLSLPTNATIAGAQGTGTIQNDDAAVVAPEQLFRLQQTR